MKISREFTFCASHIVPNHPGKCRNLHGHNWHVVVELEDDINSETGMVIDFADLKKAVMPIINRLDHKHLNWYLKVPTAENLAIYIAYEVASVLGVNITVKVRETEPTEAVFNGTLDFQSYSFTQNKGWQEPFQKFVAFENHKVMAKWYHKKKRVLEETLQYLHLVGSEIASFEMYRASLDEHEAGKLLSELKYYEEQAKLSKSESETEKEKK